MIIDKRKKEKTTVNKIPAPVTWILENSTGEQLDCLKRWSGSNDFKTIINIISKFKDYNVYEVFYNNVTSSHELDLLRASKRGEVAGLDAMILAAQMADQEIKRRRRLKENGAI